MLLESLNKVIEERKRWLANSFGIGIAGGYVEEMLHHSIWAQKLCVSFVGRKELLDEALNLIVNERAIVGGGVLSLDCSISNSYDFQGICCSIVGE